MNEKIKNVGILAISASAIVASSIYAYSNVVKDNKVAVIQPPTTILLVTPTQTKSAYKYKDGVYTVSGEYDTSGPTHHKMEVVLTLSNDVINDASTELKDSPLNTSAATNNDKFEVVLKTAVVGKKLDELTSLGVIGGSSNTTTGFKAAVELVKSQATLSSK